jgi:hypothetical protein
MINKRKLLLERRIARLENMIKNESANSVTVDEAGDLAFDLYDAIWQNRVLKHQFPIVRDRRFRFNGKDRVTVIFSPMNNNFNGEVLNSSESKILSSLVNQFAKDNNLDDCVVSIDDDEITVTMYIGPKYNKAKSDYYNDDEMWSDPDYRDQLDSVKYGNSDRDTRAW